MDGSGRYSRQLVLEELGEKGQQKLAKSSILLVGCGGLGSAALPFLVSAGIGKIGIIDGDRIELSNLHRQVLYSENDIGKFKVDIAKERLQSSNNSVQIQCYKRFLEAKDALELFPEYDIIVDATDRIQLRYLISDACILTNRPFVHAAIEKWEGQVSVFNYKGGPSYRDLYPEMNMSAPSCAEAGVMGTTVGIIGLIQAQEVIKMSLGLEGVLSGKLFLLNTLNYSQRILTFNKHNSTNFNEESFLSEYQSKEVALAEIQDENYFLIDVRENGENPILESDQVKKFPLSKIEEEWKTLSDHPPLFLFCQSGIRSEKAYKTLKSKGLENVFLLKEQAGDLSDLIGA